MRFFPNLCRDFRTDHCRFTTIDETGDQNAVPVCPRGLDRYFGNVMDTGLFASCFFFCFSFFVCVFLGGGFAHIT